MEWNEVVGRSGRAAEQEPAGRLGSSALPAYAINSNLNMGHCAPGQGIPHYTCMGHKTLQSLSLLRTRLQSYSAHLPTHHAIAVLISKSRSDRKSTLSLSKETYVLTDQCA